MSTTTTATSTRHRGLALFPGFVSLSAYGGVVGFLSGAIDMGPEITSRLPFASPVLAGTALLLVVALPTTVAAVAAWRGSPRAGDLTAAAGLLLVGWIVVQVLVIREFSWFQPVYGLVGLVLLVLGLRLRDPKRTAGE
jgi:ABC-type antimicrobial peptide transport system permease subunit